MYMTMEEKYKKYKKKYLDFKKKICGEDDDFDNDTYSFMDKSYLTYSTFKQKIRDTKFKTNPDKLNEYTFENNAYFLTIQYQYINKVVSTNIVIDYQNILGGKWMMTISKNLEEKKSDKSKWTNYISLLPHKYILNEFDKGIIGAAISSVGNHVTVESKYHLLFDLFNNKQICKFIIATIPDINHFVDY